MKAFKSGWFWLGLGALANVGQWVLSAFILQAPSHMSCNYVRPPQPEDPGVFYCEFDEQLQAHELYAALGLTLVIALCVALGVWRFSRGR